MTNYYGPFDADKFGDTKSLDSQSHFSKDSDVIEEIGVEVPASDSKHVIETRASSFITIEGLRDRLRDACDLNLKPRKPMLKTYIFKQERAQEKKSKEEKRKKGARKLAIAAKDFLAIIDGDNLSDDFIERAVSVLNLDRDTEQVGATGALRDMVAKYKEKYRTRELRQPLLRHDTFTHRVWNGIRIILEARVDFVNTILIPVILMLVVTAGVFYDAYKALGDNDTAHSLAYDLLYSWLIILCVAANCYTSSLTPGLIERTIGHVLPISHVTVKLRERYTNSLK